MSATNYPTPIRQTVFRKGEQIAYIPNHAEGNINHPDVEFGFVTSMNGAGDVVFCRYWRKGHIGELRTLANSEGTPVENVIAFSSVHPIEVARWLAKLYPEGD